MKVVLLAGGGGKHLLPLTEIIPKPLLPLTNKPLALHLIDLLKRSGFTDFIATVDSDKAEMMNVLGNGSRHGVTIRYVFEDRPLGTAGAMGQLASVIGDEPFIVVSCNLLFDFDLRELVNRHKQAKAAATMLVSPIPAGYESGRNEMVETDENGRVKRIERMNDQSKEAKIFPLGIYCFAPEVFQFYEERDSYLDIKEQLLRRLLAAGKSVATVQASGYWRYLFTVEDYLKMNFEMLERHLGASRQIKQKQPNVWLGKNVHLGQNVNFITPVIIGNNAIIEDNVQLIGPVVIGDGCRIESATIIRESTLWEGAAVARAARVERSIITRGSRVNPGQEVQDTVVVKNQLPPATVNLLAQNYKITTITSSTPAAMASVRRRRAFEITKRAFDIVFSSLLIILLLPLMGILGLAIKLDSPGPIFFRQKRCGLFGREFKLIKYRSMVPDAHQRQKEFKHLNEVDGPVFKINNDPRITRVGRFLRKLSLDEIPQLFNILKGDMSFVGPRPLARNELRLNPHWSETRLCVKPGLTGLWQVSGRSNSSFQDWVAFDTYYAKHQNFGLDLKILIKTPLKVVLGSGAC